MSSIHYIQIPMCFPERKLCECGCGLETHLSSRTWAKYGSVKGQPLRFLHGHHLRIVRPPTKPSRPIAERFWEKVDRSGDCWIWQSYRGHKGYGRFTYNGTRKTLLAHRVAYELTYGPIPEGTCVLHRCDVPACCNPAHLWLGTIADNNADMFAKGRHPPLPSGPPLGEHNGAAKLTAALVLAIRAAYVPRKVTLRALAARFEISPSQVYMIVHRRVWQHLD